MKNDVLLVHAAGNASENLDTKDHFPNPVYADKSDTAKAWIEVGASDAKGKAANFSNYGKKDVDIFAPGVAIYSTLPFNQFRSWDGTSMAAPVVAGLACLIREYYPTLTAIQVKDIILRSAQKSSLLADKCVSGGVANAYNALKLAASYK
jgi:subtilisin family serine protease